MSDAWTHPLTLTIPQYFGPVHVKSMLKQQIQAIHPAFSPVFPTLFSMVSSSGLLQPRICGKGVDLEFPLCMLLTFLRDSTIDRLSYILQEFKGRKI